MSWWMIILNYVAFSEGNSMVSLSLWLVDAAVSGNGYFQLKNDATATWHQAIQGVYRTCNNLVEKIYL